MSLPFWREVWFTGGSLNGKLRLVRDPIEVGDTYEIILTGEVYRWDGEAFVLDGRRMRVS